MTMYTLDAKGEPQRVNNYKEWDEGFVLAERNGLFRVAADGRMKHGLVSTVFIGLDYCWETMVFGGNWDGLQLRCCGSRADAKAQHNAVVKTVGRGRIRRTEDFR